MSEGKGHAAGNKSSSGMNSSVSAVQQKGYIGQRVVRAHRAHKMSASRSRHESRGSKTLTAHLDTPPRGSHDSVFDPVYETPSSMGTPSTIRSPDGHRKRRRPTHMEDFTEDSTFSGTRRKRKFTAFGVAQPRRERHMQATHVRSDLFHTFEEVQDYMCDFRFKSQVINTRTMPKFCNTTEFSRSNFFRCHDAANTALADGLIDSDRWGLAELFNPIGVRGSSSATIAVADDDPILFNEQMIPQEIVMAQRQEETKKTEAEEALFLRRQFLISNDLYADGYHFKHGTDGAEKAVHRDAPPLDSREGLIKRVEKTFEALESTPIHPTAKEMKVKRVMKLVPNRELWAHPYAQMKFDEPPPLPEDRNTEIPPIIYKATPTPRLTAFAVFQHQKGTTDHELEKSYAWDNQHSANDKEDFVLIDWPEDETRNQVFFSRVSNKIRLKKLTAKVQKQRSVYQKQVFGTEALRILWRDPTEEEKVAEDKKMEVLHAEYAQPRKNFTYKQLLPPGDHIVRGA